MRMLLKATMPTDKANAVIQEGRMQDELQRVMSLLKPEAAYFYGEDGKRTMLAVFAMDDPSQLPVLTEPLFRGVEASVYITPVMNQEDLQKGLQQAFG